MFCRLEVASDCLETLFVVIIAFFNGGNVVIRKIATLFLTYFWSLFDCNVFLFGLFSFLVFIQRLVVHFDEIQGLIGHLQSFLIFLNILRYITNFFSHSRLCLILILLQYLFLAFGGIVINWRIHLYFSLIEGHDIFIIGCYFFKKGLIVLFDLIGRFTTLLRTSNFHRIHLF